MVLKFSRYAYLQSPPLFSNVHIITKSRTKLLPGQGTSTFLSSEIYTAPFYDRKYQYTENVVVACVCNTHARSLANDLRHKVTDIVALQDAVYCEPYTLMLDELIYLCKMHKLPLVIIHAAECDLLVREPMYYISVFDKLL